MNRYVIEYYFGENDKIKQIVESDSSDMDLVLLDNTSKGIVSFVTDRDHYYQFNFSDVKYTKVYPYTRPKVMPKPKGL